MIRKVHQIVKTLTTKNIHFDIDLLPFSCQELEYKKILNWVRTESSVIAKPGVPWGYPTILQLEPTTRCNLHCPACPVSCGLGRETGDMDFNLYQRIVNELHPYLLAMLFWDWGEPFLHPQAYDMIALARKKGIKVMASTNGHLFSQIQHAEKVVQSKLDVLVFSIDGLQQQTYEKFRESGKLHIALEGVSNVLQERKRQASRLPLVNLRFIVNRTNEHELPSVKSFAEALGVDVLTLRKYHSISDFVTTVSADQNFIPQSGQFQLPLRNKDNEIERIRKNSCKNLWNCPTIHWDGTVCSCFMDYSQQRPLGNVQHESIKEIWRGQKYQRLRKQFKKEWGNTPICDSCSNGFLGGNVGRDANAQAIFFANI